MLFAIILLFACLFALFYRIAVLQMQLRDAHVRLERLERGLEFQHENALYHRQHLWQFAYDLCDRIGADDLPKPFKRSEDYEA
jgi:hypothetical protein